MFFRKQLHSVPPQHDSKQVRCHGPQEGRKLKGLPSSSTGLPLVHLAQQVASMNPTKNPRKIKPSQPAKLSMQPHLPPTKFKTPNATLHGVV